MNEVLEWWPDYGGQLFHLRTGPGGVLVAIEDLPLAETTVASLRLWLSAYDDTRLPLDGCGDSVWLKQGVALLAKCREELRQTHDVVVTEPWWDEEPSA